MDFSKNIQFSKLIKVNGHLREFNFRRKAAPDGPVYDVDVSDERGNRIYFSMHEVNGVWTIREAKIPAWIAGAASLFHTEIMENGT